MTTTNIAIDIVRDVMKIMEHKEVCYLDIPQSLIDSVENFLSLAVWINTYFVSLYERNPFCQNRSDTFNFI